MRLKFARYLKSKAARPVLVGLVLAVGGVTALALSQAATQPAETSEPPRIMPAISAEDLAAEQIIIRYKPNADLEALRQQYDALGAGKQDELVNLRMNVIKVPKLARAAVIKALSSNPNIEFVEADSVQSVDVTTPNDPEYSQQWAWTKTQTNLAWDTAKGSPDMVVAVIDSGINFDHPEFAGKTVAGIDYVNNDNDPTDDNKHGTAVSGVIAALTNNGVGVASGCWNCRIMPVKVMGNDGKGATSNIVKGIQYAADKGAKIINMSIGGSGTSAAQESAIKYAAGKGAVLVASAGNNGNDEPQRPAIYPETISVAATDQADKLTSYSSFGPHIDIAAPGQARTAAHDGPTYITINGTSFSAPTVSAIIGLLWSAVPNATPAQLRDAIQTTTEPCCEGKIAGGRINAAKALAKLTGGSLPTDTTPPTVSFTAPAAGAVLTGTVQIAANAGDNFGVTKVELQINNGTPASDASSPYTFSWNTDNAAEGQHTLKLTAYDAAGNKTTVSRTVNVRVQSGGKAGDVNGDNSVNISDLSLLLSAWNTNNGPADLNKSGKVDIADLSLLLSKWGT